MKHIRLSGSDIGNNNMDILHNDMNEHEHPLIVSIDDRSRDGHIVNINDRCHGIIKNYICTDFFCQCLWHLALVVILTVIMVLLYRNGVNIGIKIK